MGNRSGTNAPKDSDVIAAIVDEKNKWHETLSGAKHPDMDLINDMLFNTYQRIQHYVRQIHSKPVEIQTDRDKRRIELEDKLEQLQTEKGALRSSPRRDTSTPIATSDQVPGRKESSSRHISTSDQVPGRKESKYTGNGKIHSKSAEIQTDPDKRMIKLEEQLEKLKTEKEELTLRLSKVVGEKLMKDNPNVTDLSDKNRPTKLGEVYTELYDNEWTDAYEALTKSGYKDNEAIETLLKTLKACFEFCQSKADQLLESTVEAAANVLFQEVHEQMKDQKKRYQMLAVVSKQDYRSNAGVLNQFYFKTLRLQSKWKSKLKDATDQNNDLSCTIYQPQSFEEELTRTRKQMSQVLIPVVQNVFLKTYWDDNCIPELKPFIRKSLFVCWMMVVQGPPMCFDWNTKQGSQYDANLYRHYTALGTVVEFVVWPALFLHKDGPTIAKGVVQPKKELLA